MNMSPSGVLRYSPTPHQHGTHSCRFIALLQAEQRLPLLSQEAQTGEAGGNVSATQVLAKQTWAL